MVSDWIRRSFDAVGVTQYKPGKHLAALQEPHLGKVILCIDVSSSMSGTREFQTWNSSTPICTSAMSAASSST